MDVVPIYLLVLTRLGSGLWWIIVIIVEKKHQKNVARPTRRQNPSDYVLQTLHFESLLVLTQPSNRPEDYDIERKSNKQKL